MALIGGINFQQWNVFAMLSFIQLNEKDDRCAKTFHKWFFFSAVFKIEFMHFPLHYCFVKCQQQQYSVYETV